MNDGVQSNCIAHCGRYECKMYGCQTIARNRLITEMGRGIAEVEVRFRRLVRQGAGERLPVEPNEQSDG